jgi:hypothetical protein
MAASGDCQTPAVSSEEIPIWGWGTRYAPALHRGAIPVSSPNAYANSSRHINSGSCMAVGARG